MNRQYKTIIYNEDDLHYIEGELQEITCEPTYYGDRVVQTTTTLVTSNKFDSDDIKLDPTMMKRILKYNKETEIKKLDKEITHKQEELKELEDKIEDRAGRWDLVKKYISNIYNVDLTQEDNEEDDEWEEDWLF